MAPAARPPWSSMPSPARRRIRLRKTPLTPTISKPSGHPRFLWFRRCRNYAPATPLDPLARRRSSCPEGVRESPAQPKTGRRLCEGTPCLRLSNQYSQRSRFDQENIGKDQAEPQPKGLRRSLDDRREDMRGCWPKVPTTKPGEGGLDEPKRETSSGRRRGGPSVGRALTSFSARV